ncbi:response regulator [Leifsonia sp. NPDC058292]|uniref:response regulator n=1 Tax=Leifsonia sp. NPDC058292 TaxID=3346428 RepID=UPI0036D7B534
MQHTDRTGPNAAKRKGLRVIVADDDEFTASLVSEGLRAQGFDVLTATSAQQAWELAARVDPHAVISDLIFASGESGAELLRRIHAAYPWVGLVVLTSHQSPELAIEASDPLPAGSIYLVKSRLQGIAGLASAITDAISGQSEPEAAAESKPETIILTRAQAEVLRMLAGGASTKAIAESRGTTVRAAETMLARLYLALGVDTDERSNPRVAAAQLWQRGRIGVR